MLTVCRFCGVGWGGMWLPPEQRVALKRSVRHPLWNLAKLTTATNPSKNLGLAGKKIRRLRYWWHKQHLLAYHFSKQNLGRCRGFPMWGRWRVSFTSTWSIWGSCCVNFPGKCYMWGRWRITSLSDARRGRVLLLLLLLLFGWTGKQQQQQQQQQQHKEVPHVLQLGGG